MKSKQDLKSFFENGDRPNQEQFWELIESYFHKDEPITLEELSMLKANLATIDKTSDGKETLGNVDTKEQVNTKINAAINALKANAPETYDTLKEIADYIANDSNAEAALLQLINTKINKPTIFASYPSTSHKFIPVIDSTGDAKKLSLSTILDPKLDKPTMTNNYYGLWDDTNKKFVNGNLRQINFNGKKTNVINVSNDTDVKYDVLQMGRYYDEDSDILIPDGYFFGIGETNNINNLIIRSSKIDGYKQYQSHISQNNGDRYSTINIGSSYEDTYHDYNDYSSANIHISSSAGDSRITIGGKNISIGGSESVDFMRGALSFNTIDDSWYFTKPIEGANIKGGLKFTLPRLPITPKPNMLIPKTDGSGLMWYDTSSIGKNIALLEDIEKTPFEIDNLNF